MKALDLVGAALDAGDDVADLQVAHFETRIEALAVAGLFVVEQPLFAGVFVEDNLTYVCTLGGSGVFIIAGVAWLPHKGFPIS